jgi:signal transduction histidine kinase
MQRIREGFDELNAADIALIVVVVIGYIVGVATGITTAWDLNPAIVLVTFAMTAVYLGLARGADQYFERYNSGWATFAYFAIQLMLVNLTIILLGPGAWLISLPMAALAVEHLSRWWQRWIVYLGILLGLAIPFLREGRWQEAFYFALTLSPAILFVVVFTRLVNSEQQARRDAEALAAELEEANHQLAAYSTQVEELARTKERNLLAREIHDSLGHYLTVVNVQIRAAQAVMDSDPQKAQEALENAQRLTKDGLDAVRQSVAALRESPLGNRSLVDAVELLAAETEKSDIVVNTDVRGETVVLDPKAELTLYRAVQEGLTNVRKHARASRVDLTLDFNDASQVTLTIADNGAGAAQDSQGGYGLLGMQERVELLGGTMDAGSAPGEGFVLTISLPLERPSLAGDTAVSGAV